MKKTILLFALILIFCSGLFGQATTVWMEAEGDSVELNATTQALTVNIDLGDNTKISIADSIGVSVFQDSTGGGITGGDSMRSRVYIDYYSNKDRDDKVATDTLLRLASVSKDFEGQKTWTRFYFTLRHGYRYIKISLLGKYGGDSAAAVLSGSETMGVKWVIGLMQYKFR